MDPPRANVVAGFLGAHPTDFLSEVDHGKEQTARLERSPIGWIISGSGEGVGEFGRGVGVDDAGDCIPKGVDRALGGSAQQRLEPGEGVLDRVEVGVLSREEAQAGAIRASAHGIELRLESWGSGRNSSPTL